MEWQRGWSKLRFLSRKKRSFGMTQRLYASRLRDGSRNTLVELHLRQLIERAAPLNGIFPGGVFGDFAGFQAAVQFGQRAGVLALKPGNDLAQQLLVRRNARVKFANAVQRDGWR